MHANTVHGHKGQPNCGIDRIGPRGSLIGQQGRGAALVERGRCPAHHITWGTMTPCQVLYGMRCITRLRRLIAAPRAKVKPRNEQDTTTLSKIFTPVKGWIRAWFKEQSPPLGLRDGERLLRTRRRERWRVLPTRDASFHHAALIDIETNTTWPPP